MNFSIFSKLLIANVFNKVKISDSYKHLDVMIHDELIDRIPDGTWSEVAGWPCPNYTEYYAITIQGKKVLFDYQKHLITRFISIIALIISILSYVKK